MKMYDRLYKEMVFPPMIMELLNCPGLLRLRDVRMANNQFVSFPAFSTTSRYEHSLGVCYLAGLCAKELCLNEKETLELMIAGLYHDVGTPPFAHAMEEVLQAKFGFDHELNMKKLIIGNTGEFDGEFAQVYQGEGLKLRSLCQSKKARELNLDPNRIAKIIAGDRSIPLSRLINGDEIDLDNIDNIFRASSAMGLISDDCGETAKKLAQSFILQNDKLFYNGFNKNEIITWLEIRNLQYTAIYDSVDDFSYQTMIKKAICLLLEDDNSSKNLDSNSWRLTDSTLTNDYLLKNKNSAPIMRRVMLCKPFHCLGILYVSGKEASKYINENLQQIEAITSEHFIATMGFSDKQLQQININPVVTNFYPDKRNRVIKNKVLLWNHEENIDYDYDKSYGALLGLFTPLSNSNYKTLETGERKVVTFGQSQLKSLMDLLSNEILGDFKISVYGSKKNGENNSKTEQSQLGLF